MGNKSNDDSAIEVADLEMPIGVPVPHSTLASEQSVLDQVTWEMTCAAVEVLRSGQKKAGGLTIADVAAAVKAALAQAPAPLSAKSAALIDPSLRVKAHAYWDSIKGPGAGPADRLLCVESHIAGQKAWRAGADTPDDLRALGWAVAVHNDYRLNGDAHTFWLLTKGDRCVKGEGRTDAEALNMIRGLLVTAHGDEK